MTKCGTPVTPAVWCLSSCLTCPSAALCDLKHSLVSLQGDSKYETMLHSRCVPSRAVPQVSAGMPHLMRHALQHTYAFARAQKADMQHAGACQTIYTKQDHVLPDAECLDWKL